MNTSSHIHSHTDTPVIHHTSAQSTIKQYPICFHSFIYKNSLFSKKEPLFPSSLSLKFFFFTTLRIKQPPSPPPQKKKKVLDKVLILAQALSDLEVWRENGLQKKGGGGGGLGGLFHQGGLSSSIPLQWGNFNPCVSQVMGQSFNLSYLCTAQPYLTNA